MAKNRFIANVTWNIAGQLLPLSVAILIVPKLISALGIDKYGFLTMAWALIGYAGFFDFGMSRAMTRVVAHHVAEHNDAEAKRVASVATSFMLALAIFSSFLIFTTAKLLIKNWLNIPESLESESVNAMRLLALSIPFVMSTAAYRGIMEAYHEFKPLNIISICMGSLTYIAPLIAIFFSPRLESVVGSVVITRIASNLWHILACKRACKYRYKPTIPDYKTITQLFNLGGWISISNIASPFMTTMDRFVLAGMVSVDLLAYYTTPYDVINKLLFLPYALMGVMFPLMSGQINNKSRANAIYATTIRMLYVTMFPIVFFIVIFSRQGLSLWLGEQFANNGTLVLQILALGIFLNTLAQAPATAIQSIGNPKWMAIMHIIELPLYLGALWFLTKIWGITGTAIAWSGRMLVDCVILYLLTGRKLLDAKLKFKQIFSPIFLTFLLLSIGFTPTNQAQSIAAFTIGIIIFIVYAWIKIITPEDKTRISGLLE
jgi:O-antigen/teichoic acid export membrane protein